MPEDPGNGQPNPLLVLQQDLEQLMDANKTGFANLARPGQLQPAT
jgi:hypothetical protein